MKLPRWLTTVTPLSKKIALLLFIVMPIAAFHYGRYYQKGFDIVMNAKEIEPYINLSNDKEDEIQLLLHNKGKFVKSHDEISTPDRLGFYMPMLDGKAMHVSTFTYKRNVITEKAFVLDRDANGDNETTVDVWEFTSGRNNLADTQSAYVIFGAYGNYTMNPMLLKDIMSFWQESYTTSNGIKMYWSYGGGPKDSDGPVSLQFFMPYGLVIHPQLVSLTLKEAPTLKAKEELKKIADEFRVR